MAVGDFSTVFGCVASCGLGGSDFTVSTTMAAGDFSSVFSCVASCSGLTASGIMAAFISSVFGCIAAVSMGSSSLGITRVAGVYSS